MKEIYEMQGQGYSARAIARELGLARNTVLKYLTAAEAIVPKPRPLRGSKLDPYTEHIDRRMGFDIRLCRPYRAQTKGKVESGVKYVRRIMWPSIRFTDDSDLNRQALEWCDAVANTRVGRSFTPSLTLMRV